ncbi:MAG TPA: molybdopterin-dependent oxidoreductase [Gaiellales bacterium]|jgi:anaerobic selenocysteine-containing dehydrogenase
MEIVRTTCPRDCYDSCGVLVAIEDGRIKHVRGDPEHHVARGKLCRKCSIGYNGAFLDATLRLTTPLRRSGPKGERRFEAVGWDEAIAGIAARLSAITAEQGAASVLNAHYTGTCALIDTAFPQRFFNRLGATEVSPDTVCNNAGHVALGYVYGSSEEGFDPEAASAAACIVVWGANPSASAPHQHDHWLREAPGHVIVIDPIRTPSAAAADTYLQLRPGSDAALAFALAHVIRRDGLADEAFIAEHVLGYDELEPQLAACTPAWGEAQTGIRATLIEHVAHTYARGPSLLWMGQGLQRQPRGGNVMRAIAMLPALSGNIRRPGSGFLYLNGGDSRGIDFDWLSGAELARADAPAAISQMDLADVLASPSRSRALVCWNINPVASSPEQAALKRALEREDLLTVVCDLFLTDTAAYADYVLPAASFLECDDILPPYFHHTLSAQVKAVDPPGEALRNAEIFRRLAAAMGFEEPALQEPDGALIEHLLAPSGIAWGELARAGTVRLYPEPRVQFADGFPTPSGKIEIASAQAEADGHPRLPEPSVDEPAPAGYLRLLSPASPWLMNSTFGNDAKLRKRIGAASVALHPREASSRGLRRGDEVLLRNATGELRLIVDVTDAVPPGVAYAPKCRWPSHEQNGANVNALNPGAKTDMGESSAVHGVLVELVPR